MAISLRSGRELKEIEENEKKMAKIEKHAEIREYIKQHSLEIIKE